MFTVTLPFRDTSILLVPQFGWLSPSTQWVLISALCLVPLFLVLWLYRYEMKLVTPRTAAGLLALRVTVLVLMLFLVCLQPVCAYSPARELRGRVLIAIDRSDSMEITDPQRPVAEKLRLRAR